MATTSYARTITEQQRAAIEGRGVSIALSAGAGCGKTFVLTERFLSHLGPGARDAQLHQLIAITFTERAAREMRDRIRGEVRRRLEVAEGVDAEYWLAQLRTLHTARISTIHSFCQSLLRAHPAEAGLDPSFCVLDEVEASTLLLAAIEEALQRQLAERVAGVMRLAVDFGMSRLRSMAIQLIRGRQQLWYDQWLGRSTAELVAAWRHHYRNRTLPQALAQFSASDCVQTVLTLLRENTPTHPLMRERRDQLIELLPQLGDSRQRNRDVAAILENARVQNAGGAKSWPDVDTYQRVKNGLDELRDSLGQLESLLTWDGGGADEAARAGLDLLRLCAGIRDRYQERKQTSQALDFDDLLIHARLLLTDDRHRELQRQISQRVILLLVDEFQDTDTIQLDLIRALCNDDLASGKLFVVGDAKQSIYRFRGAEPGVFRELRAKLPPRGQLPLDLNFRSQPSIINFVNAVFCDAIQAYEPLRAKRPSGTPPESIELLIAPADAPNELSDQMRGREAEWLARRLKQLLECGEPLVCAPDATPRKLAAGDIAILFRALSNVDHYEAALRRHGINYYLVGGHAFYSQQEVFDLVNVLRAVACEADEVSLLGALRSPFFSISDDALFWLSQGQQGFSVGFYSEDLPQQLTAEERARVDFARSVILALRSKKDRVPISQLVNEALDRTGYDAILLSEFLGERKLANLRKLVEMARKFERSGLFTLGDFIAQLSEFVAKHPDEALAATQAETSKVVRIMTIHQAKGLEFPLVVIPDLERPSRSRSLDGVAFDRELGPLVKLPKGVPGADSVCGFDLFCRQEAEEDAAELLRLLYVAMTRAADYLILSTSIKDPAKPTSRWMKLLAERFDLATGDLRATLPPDFESPARLKISWSEPQISPGASGRLLPKLSTIVEAVEKPPRSKKPAAANPRLEPILPSAHSRRRYSFSRLSGELRGIDDPQAEIPFDGQAREVDIDPLRLGTIVHAVLAEMRTDDQFDTAARVRHHAQIYLREEPALLAKACELVDKFTQTERFQNLRDARQLHTELEFLLNWPPGAVQSDCYLHGFIDCLYQDRQGNWRILDYKTNRVSRQEVPQAAAPYEMQMLVYALAAQQVLGTSPAGLILCFLQPGCEHEIAFDASARKRACNLVDRAIALVNNLDTVVV